MLAGLTAWEGGRAPRGLRARVGRASLARARCRQRRGLEGGNPGLACFGPGLISQVQQSARDSWRHLLPPAWPLRTDQPSDYPRLDPRPRHVLLRDWLQLGWDEFTRAGLRCEGLPSPGDHIPTPLTNCTASTQPPTSHRLS